MECLSVDPGMNTGWAHWSDKHLVEYGQITAKHKTLSEDLVYLSEHFGQLLLRLQPDKVYLEYPGFWGGSSTSMASLSSGDLVKLAAITGVYIGLAAAYNALPVLITPQEWKGQMPKEGVKVRVQRALGVIERSSHMNDAIGIGLHVTGRFKVRNETRPFS